MQEGQYRIRFALNESITIYYYQDWKGRKITRGKYEIAKDNHTSSNRFLTSYQITPKFTEFVDCIHYTLNPPYLDVIDAYISCELYSLSKKTLPSPAHITSRYRKSDICTVTWDENEKVINITLNSSGLFKRTNSTTYLNKRVLKVALTCNVERQDSNILTYEIPITFNYATNEKNGTYILTNPTSFTKGAVILPLTSYSVYYTLAIVLFVMTIVLSAVFGVFCRLINKRRR